ncbi:hypothetical protein GF358_00650 [Candidatus Woesearchaeota archaeon]|nr:hypothetical protein [Candidatus Woesearchaeota archaeon]
MIKKIICLTMLFILIGCTGMRFPKNKEAIPVPDIHQGTTAIEMQYTEGMPPKEIFEKQLFEIGLELQNKGATDIQNGIFNLAVNEQFITLLDEQMTRFNIKGKSVYNPIGGKEQIRIKAQSRELGRQISGQSTTLIANACYQYQTKATILTCIDPQPLKKETKVCTVQSQSTPQGQGGPIAVTNIEPKMMPHQNPDKIKPAYVITIKNLGNGQVIEPNTIYDACTGRNIGKENYDILLINALLSNEILNCEPQTLKLRQNENKILCESTAGIPKTAGNYQTPITIELEYGYIQTIPKTIRIAKRTY